MGPRNASGGRALDGEGRKDLTDAALESGGAAMGALVGFAVGGPVGAVVGAVVPPTASLTIKLSQRIIERRRNRATRILTQAVIQAGLRPDEALAALEEDLDRAETFLRLISQALSSHPDLDDAYSALLGQLLGAASPESADRIDIIADALTNFRGIHLRVINEIDQAGGDLSAHDIASSVHVPEVELRPVVRELELRGVIKDLGAHPVVWRLREFGAGIAQLIRGAEPHGH